uniref:C-type lectin domain-containing protein n=1 Tax=Laticauda laticaudata TaxID=8630 RepID=A0A8C5S517_LATLA
MAPLSLGLLVCLVLAPFAANAQADPCPAGWLSYNGHCYGYFEQEVNWQQAEAFCQSHNGHLASIQTREEHQAVADFLTKAQWWEREDVWLGLFLPSQVSDWMGLLVPLPPRPLLPPLTTLDGLPCASRAGPGLGWTAAPWATPPGKSITATPGRPALPWTTLTGSCCGTTIPATTGTPSSARAWQRLPPPPREPSPESASPLAWPKPRALLPTSPSTHPPVPQHLTINPF